MATKVLINNQLPDGSSPPPHIIIQDADFIPNVGDLVEHDGKRYKVQERMFTYSLDGKHGVLVTVTPAK
jgi:hypothetical protein